MPPQSNRWSSNRAVLFVHGVGNARPGDYNPLVAQVQNILGGDANNVAFYFLYYDQINDWFATKTRAAQQAADLVTAIRSQLASMAPNLGNAIADFAGDVLWPVILADGRQAVRAAYLAQLQQMVRDGTDDGRGRLASELRITIIAHSLGCFHTYETLHAAAADPSLSPAKWGLQFDHVIYMASPVQLIRTIAGKIRIAIPQRETLYCVSPSGLSNPGAKDEENLFVKSAKHTVSITGNLDPVGGYYFRDKAAWAYTQLPEQESIVDQQQVADVNNMPEDQSLAAILQAALRERERPSITPLNPHDWSAYVQRHEENLRQWLT